MLFDLSQTLTEEQGNLLEIWKLPRLPMETLLQEGVEVVDLVSERAAYDGTSLQRPSCSSQIILPLSSFFHFPLASIYPGCLSD